jgi:signal transduction histidine kinase
VVTKRMPQAPTRWIALLLAGFFPILNATADTQAKPGQLSLTELQQRIVAIDSELEQLARYSLRSGVGAIGFRSESHTEPGAKEWIEIHLGDTHPIDEIVMVPTLWRDSKKGFQADGFPEAFRVIAGKDNQDEGTVIATYDSRDKLLPRIAPIVIPTKGIVASWIRIEATQLSRRAFDEEYVFQLAELMVFSGDKNVALRKSISSSSVHPTDRVHAWDIVFLTDGHMPYLMDAAQGLPSTAYIRSLNKLTSLNIDLGETHTISEIHLHAVDQSDTVPQAYPGNLGIPEKLLVEGALSADFSDAVPLVEIKTETFTNFGPVIMWPFPETACRYIRIRSPDEYDRSRFGFAEIELFSNGKNIALKQSVSAIPNASPDLENDRNLSALTDGRNLYGKILSVHSWMKQLARRHELEAERPLIVAELNQSYAKQKRNLWLMTWLAALLAAAVGFTILIDRMLRMRHAVRIRERLAADLHDELGANIHTIGLLGDLARDAESRDELLELLDRSRVFTERSGVALRNCTNMLEASELCEDLVVEMKRCANTLLADLDHNQVFEGMEHITKLNPKKRVGVFFFYKECLTNILRHSAATQATTRLVATTKTLELSIKDNGHGINEEIPASLRRRARLLRGKVTVESTAEQGTLVTLFLKIN